MKRPTHVENEDQVLMRITDQLIEQGKSQKELVESLGLKKGIYTAWKSGLSTSYRKYMYEIAAYLKVSPNFLLNGEENEDDEEKLIRLYRNMDKTRRSMLLSYAYSI